MIGPLWYDFKVIIQPLLGGYLAPYAIILSGFAAVGLGLSVWLCKEDRVALVDAGLAALFVSLLSARIGFVLRNFSYFKINLVEIPQLWLGGLSWPGALIGFGLALVGIHWIRKESLGELADSFLPLVGTLVLGVWLTSWGSRIGYGPSLNAWFGIPVRDILGLVSRRWPLPLIGAVASTAWMIATILFPLKKIRQPGYRSLLALAGIMAINGLISIFRADPAPLFLNLRWESWFSIVILAGAAFLIFLQREKPIDGKPNS